MLPPFKQFTLLYCLLLSCNQVAVAARPSDEFSTAVDEMLTVRSENSRKFELWFKYYSNGEIGKADNVWSSVLAECAKRETIGDFLENINERCWFAEDNQNKKRVDAQKAYEHLLDCTERDLGKEHRFVADLCKFLATYAESQHKYQKAELYRLREVRLHEKALGAANEHTLEGMQKLARLYVTMNNYKQAAPIYARLVSLSQQVGKRGLFEQSTREYIALLRRSGRDTEARRLVAKYKTYMWDKPVTKRTQ